MNRDIITTSVDAGIMGVIGYHCVNAMQGCIETFRSGKWAYFVKEPRFFKSFEALSALKVGSICSLFVCVDFIALKVFSLMSKINPHEPLLVLGRLCFSIIVTTVAAACVGLVANAELAIAIIGASIALYSLVHRIAEQFNRTRYSVMKNGLLIIAN